MKVEIKSFRTAISGILVLGLLLYAAVKISWLLDETLPVVESWLLSSSEVINYVGQVKEITPKKVTHVSRSSNSSGYKKYTLLVQGERNDALVRVKIGDDGSIKIYDIE